MKKRTMAFGGLLMAVAITASSVAGTYAKYISQVDYTDEARVAKFYLNGAGEATQTIDLFAKSYARTEKDGKVVYVNSLKDDKVIAPGTTGEAIFQVSGEFETAYQTFIKFDGAKDVVIYFGLDAEGNVTEISDTESDTTPYAYNPITYKVYSVDEDGNHRLYDSVDSKENPIKVEKALTFNGNMEDATATAKENVYTAENVTTARNEYALVWSWDTINTVEVEVYTGTNEYGDDVYKTVKLSNDDVNKLDTYLGRKGTDKLVLNVSVGAEQVAKDYSTANN